MRGKRFVSPRSGAPPGRTGGPTATPPRPSAVSPFVSQSTSRQRRKPSPANLHVISPEPPARGGGYPSLGSSVAGASRAVSVSNVHHMLGELVQLSHSIAAYLEQDPAASGTASSPPVAGDARAVAALKAQEIERVVRRVQAHCQSRIDALEQENAALRRELEAARGGSGDAPGVRGGIAAQGRALDALDRTWAREEGGGAVAGSDLAQLRSVLLAEKRQRLLVEEQTQSLTEQHAKVVSTLERRLRKQEEQLHALIHAVEAAHSGGGGSAARARGSTSSSPGSPTTGGQVTPRRLLRQQLAQHQQTQRALQQYREHLGPDAASFSTDGDAADDKTLSGAMDAGAGGSLGLHRVQATLDAIQRSTPPVQPKPAAPRVAAEEAKAPSSGKPGREPSEVSGSAVDDIGAYLDIITKELENLGADDDFL